MYRFLLRPKWIGFHLLCIVGIIGMVNLSVWQFQRLADRQEFNESVRERTQLEVVDVTAVENEEPTDLQWRPVGAKGTYLAEEQVLVVNRSQGGRAGSNVITPLLLDDGRVVIVNRGFIALDQSAPEPPAGEVRIVGTARISESRRTGQSAEAPGDLREFLRLDLSRLDDQIDGDVLDIWIAAEVSDPVDDPLLSPVALPELSDGPHLSYAIQWLIFAVALAIGWVLAVRWSISRRRDPRSSPSA